MRVSIRSLSWVSLFGTLFGLPIVASAAEAVAPMPARVPASTNPHVSVWLSASAAVRGSDDVAWGRLPTSAVRSYAEGRRADFLASYGAVPPRGLGEVPPAACTSFLGTVGPERGSAGSLEELVKGARASFVGVVEAAAPGFWDGAPATLLQVRPSDWLRKDPALQKYESLYVPYLAARFHIGAYVFCGGSPYLPLPKVGARVVIFVFDGAVTEYVPVLLIAAPELILQADGDSLVLDDGLRLDPSFQAIPTFTELVQLLHRSMATAPRP